MSTWEERMAQRAAQRRRAAEVPRREQQTRDRRDAPDFAVYRGTCDVCFQPIEYEHAVSVDGIHDYAVDADGRVFTWIRHGVGGPLQPDCDRYFSRVYREE